MSGVEFAVSLLAIAAGLSAVMTLAWVIERRTGNAGWIDVAWTFGVGSLGIAAALGPVTDGSHPARQWLVAGLVLVWSLRLGSHIARRTLQRSDDPRYARIREGYGDSAWWQMGILAQKQALVSIPLVLAILLAAHNPEPALRIQDIVACAILAVAIAGEALADRQLRACATGDRLAICTSGLWGWSRHPNYFFEWLGWLAYPLIAIDPAGPYGWGWLALAAPACMYWLLVHVSGIPPLEEHMAKTRGAAFRDYQATTSAFFPLPPLRREGPSP